MLTNPVQPLAIVVLISGDGSNLQAIIDNIASGQLSAKLVAVISNRDQAYGLERARRHGIPTQVIAATLHPDRTAYDQALMQCIDSYSPQLIVLAGFMRILTTEFVQHYAGRLINIHPSLLPKHKGLHTHQRALDAGDNEHGATVHFVTPELDSGPIILQMKVPILPNDTAEELQQRVHQAEHQLYPEALRRIATGRVQLRGDIVYVDNSPVTAINRFIELANHAK